VQSRSVPSRTAPSSPRRSIPCTRGAGKNLKVERVTHPWPHSCRSPRHREHLCRAFLALRNNDDAGPAQVYSSDVWIAWMWRTCGGAATRTIDGCRNTPMPSPLVRSGPTRILKTYLPPPLSYSSAPVQRWSGFRGGHSSVDSALDRAKTRGGVRVPLAH
jgi:hypothetical protein